MICLCIVFDLENDADIDQFLIFAVQCDEDFPILNLKELVKIDQFR